MRIIKGSIESPIPKQGGWVQFDPYQIIGVHPAEFTPKDLFLNEILKVDNGYIKIIDFGSAALMGKGNYSFTNIKIKQVKYKLHNPTRYHFDISAYNPEEKYGGVKFGGWRNSVNECIMYDFPKEYTKKRTDPMYYSKTLKIKSIKITDLETGLVKPVEPTELHNAILNSL